MSYSNVLRLLKQALIEGEKLDLVSGEVLQLLPAVDDQGYLAIGDGTTDMDVKWFGGVSGDYVLFDVGNARVQLEDIELLLNDANITLGDNDGVVFGDGSDVTVEWNGTYLQASSALNPLWAGAPCKTDPNYESIAHEFFDDFLSLSTDWTVTEDDAACTQAVTDVVGGTLLLTCKATTDNNGHQVQFAQETFKLAAGKTLWFEARVKAAARKAGADPEIDLVIGLAAAEDMTGVADNYVADGVAFCVTEGATVFKITASKDGTHTGTVTTAVALTAGWHVLGLLIDGVTSITPYIDGVAQTPLTATICDDEELSPIFMVRNGDATITQTLEIDYVRVVQLR